MGLKSWIKRGATAVATGGLSELAGARTVADAVGHPIADPNQALPGVSDQKVLDTAASIGRNLPVIGNLIPDEKVDPNSIDTGMGYYGAAGDALTKADLNFTRPEANAADLYKTARARADTSYDAGTLRDVDLTGANRLMGRQNEDISNLRAAAIGEGPSAAQAQYAAAQAQARGQALALANTSRGAGRGAARLQALSNFGAQAGQSAAQSAALRAQEMQSAQQAYTGALQGVRAQDTALATTANQLRFQHDQAQENARLGAYQATNQAQLGYLGAAGNAVGQQTNVAQGRAGVAGQQLNLADAQARSKQEQYRLATGEEERRRKGHAENRQAITNTGMQLANKFA